MSKKRASNSRSKSTVAVRWSEHCAQETSSAFEKQILLAEAMMRRRSGLVMLGRLLWQHWRQSGWLMIVLPLVGVPVAAFITGVGFDWLMWRRANLVAQNTTEFSICVVILTSLAGSMAFLSDKERDRFRFFVDHNIPPRYVWFTRHLLWLAVTFAVGFLVIAAGGFWRYVGSSTPGASNGPPPELLIAIASAYAAGQWMSMHVRSGVLAGFFGLLLTAAL